MGFSINASAAFASTMSGASTSGRAPDLDAKLNTTRAQLEDWVTCASSKTPEGKAKIEQLTAKLNAIHQQIRAVKEKAAAGVSPTGTPAASTDLNPAALITARRSLPFDSPLGSRLDVHA